MSERETGDERQGVDAFRASFVDDEDDEEDGREGDAESLIVAVARTVLPGPILVVVVIVAVVVMVVCSVSLIGVRCVCLLCFRPTRVCSSVCQSVRDVCTV
jgi:t-SNARE complex subunit (syntaxin)